ncbi:phosphoribosylamine--glycine ligase, partial [Candidatus Uhrbacteria bacterium]|nr:phosphoribosylamine--glycine ligase [Candidatus Uhrbacteria bacterium]
VYPLCINIEHKKLFPGDIGPFTGEMGTLIFWSAPNAIFRLTLERMRESIAASGYVGYIDINCIVNARGIYPLEFTCRFGYPTISIQMEGITSPWGEFLAGIARGEAYDLKTKKGFQIGVVCAVPPFPFDDKSEMTIYHDLSILFKKNNLEGVHLGDVRIDNGDWRIAGDTGYALVVTGSGATVEEARKQAYNRVDNIMLQNMFYRTDIGGKWGEDSDKLQTWGYLY